MAVTFVKRLRKHWKTCAFINKCQMPLKKQKDIKLTVGFSDQVHDVNWVIGFVKDTVLS